MRPLLWLWWWVLMIWALQEAGSGGGDSSLTILVSLISVVMAFYGLRHWWIQNHRIRVARQALGSYPPSDEPEQTFFPRALAFRGIGTRTVLVEVEPRTEGEVAGVDVGLFTPWTWTEALIPARLNKRVPRSDALSENTARVNAVRSVGRYRFPFDEILAENGRARITFDSAPWHRHEPRFLEVDIESRACWRGQIGIRFRFAGERAWVRQTIEVN
jgi:hypothetical protein